MDDSRDGAIQALTATMDDAKEQHKQQTSQVSTRVSSEQIADLQQRAQRARQFDKKDEWQSVETEKPSDDDLPPLEPEAEDEAVKRIQGAQRGLLSTQKVRREDDPESAHEPRGRRGRPRSVQPMQKPKP